jgi:uncharacterized short protein YbdD (DUF466 family)
VTSALLKASRWLSRGWAVLREASGDDAYDRYLEHLRECPARQDHVPLTRAAFFAAEQRRKWDGVRRCC